MRIVYVGKHYNENSNDDEGAIAKSLAEFGHEVKIVQESKLTIRDYTGYDFLLFNHYKQLELLNEIKVPKVFWCFDRIHWDDARLENRNKSRAWWAHRATEISVAGFFTDGDWVEQANNPKLTWLTQGFNQYLTPAVPSGGDNKTILFTGGGKEYGRDLFVKEMRERYGERFVHRSGGWHGPVLAQAIANASIVVAPPTPVTDRYWSNRVYLTLGLGGFLLHPWTLGLSETYGSDALCMYEIWEGSEDIHYQIDWWIKNTVQRERIRLRGQEQTLAQHTYKHRVEQLIKEVEKRL